MPITWTEEEIAELRAAIASGVLRVEYAGPPARSITYQSLAEMQKLLDRMEAAAAAEAGTAPTSYRLARTRKGFDRTPRGGFRRNE